MNAAKDDFDVVGFVEEDGIGRERWRKIICCRDR